MVGLHVVVLADGNVSNFITKFNKFNYLVIVSKPQDKFYICDNNNCFFTTT